MNKDRRVFFRNATIVGATALMLTQANSAHSKKPLPSSELTERIDVTDPDYGADPSGLNSSATAFTLAAEEAGTKNIPLWIPPGSYKLDDMATLSSNNLVIIGAGRNLVYLNGSNASAFINPLLNTSLVLSGVTAQGFKRVVEHTANIDLISIEIIDCAFNNISQQVFGAGSGVAVNSIERFVFERNVVTNIGFDDADAAAVKLFSKKCNYSVIKDNLIETIGTASKAHESFGFYIKAAESDDEDNAKTIIEGNKIRNVRNYSLNNCVGIMVLGGQAIIKDNHLENIISSNPSPHNEGIYMKCRNSIISGNTLINSGGREATIICKGSNRNEIPSAGSTFGYDNIISNNTIRQDKDIGFRTTGILITVDGCIVESNHITGTQKGVAVSIGVSDTIIKGNLIYGLVVRESGFAVLGIAVANPSACSIVDNQISHLEAVASTSCYGILITGTSDSYSGCIISGNWISNMIPTSESLSRGIAVNLTDGGVCEKIIIQSNHIDNVGRGIQATNIHNAIISSVIDNTVSNYGISSVLPSDESWSLFSRNEASTS